MLTADQWKIVLYNFIQEFDKDNIDVYLNVCSNNNISKDIFQDYISKLGIDQDKFTSLVSDGSKLNNSNLSDTITKTQGVLNDINGFTYPDKNDVDKQKIILSYILNNNTFNEPQNKEIDTTKSQLVNDVDNILKETYDNKTNIQTILTCIKKYYTSLLDNNTNYLVIYKKILTRLNDITIKIIRSLPDDEIQNLLVQLTNITVFQLGITIDEIVQAILSFHKNSNTQKFSKVFFNTLQKKGWIGKQIPNDLYTDSDKLEATIINSLYQQGKNNQQIVDDLTSFFNNIDQNGSALDANITNIYSMISKILQKKKDEENKTVINKNININQTSNENMFFFKDMAFLFEEETSSNKKDEIEITDKDIQDLVKSAKKENMDIIEYCEKDDSNEEKQQETKNNNQQINNIDVSEIINNARNTKINVF